MIEHDPSNPIEADFVRRLREASLMPTVPGSVPRVYGRGLILPADLDGHIQGVNALVPHLRLPEAKLAAPATYSWLTAGVMTPIKDQGSYGNCWCFATIGAFESNWKRVNGVTISASEQQVINCNKDGYGCNGGFTAFDFLQSPGTVDESAVPYRGCAAGCKSQTGRYTVSSWAYVGNDSSIPSDATIKQYLQTYGPLLVCVDATSAWDNYSGGVMSGFASNNGSTNHMVVICGWDDSKGAWQVRNSWSTDWGDPSMPGYAWVKYGEFNLGQAASYCVVPQITPPTPVPPVPPTPVPPTPVPPTPTPVPPTPPPPTPTWVTFPIQGPFLIGQTCAVGIPASTYNTTLTWTNGNFTPLPSPIPSGVPTVSPTPSPTPSPAPVPGFNWASIWKIIQSILTPQVVSGIIAGILALFGIQKAGFLLPNVPAPVPAVAPALPSPAPPQLNVQSMTADQAKAIADYGNRLISRDQLNAAFGGTAK